VHPAVEERPGEEAGAGADQRRPGDRRRPAVAFAHGPDDEGGECAADEDAGVDGARISAAQVRGGEEPGDRAAQHGDRHSAGIVVDARVGDDVAEQGRLGAEEHAVLQHLRHGPRHAAVAGGDDGGEQRAAGAGHDEPDRLFLAGRAGPGDETAQVEAGEGAADDELGARPVASGGGRHLSVEPLDEGARGGGEAAAGHGGDAGLRLPDRLGLLAVELGADGALVADARLDVARIFVGRGRGRRGHRCGDDQQGAEKVQVGPPLPDACAPPSATGRKNPLPICHSPAQTPGTSSERQRKKSCAARRSKRGNIP